MADIQVRRLSVPGRNHSAQRYRSCVPSVGAATATLDRRPLRPSCRGRPELRWELRFSRIVGKFDRTWLSWAYDFPGFWSFPRQFACHQTIGHGARTISSQPKRILPSRTDSAGKAAQACEALAHTDAKSAR